MKGEPRSFSLEELGQLVDLPRRTLRYYIQIGLVDRPEGVGRGARYTTRHLDQLLEIRKWQQAGLSLDRIRELLVSTEGENPTPPPRPRQKGTLEVWSHLLIDEGIELVIEPQRAGLSPEQMREFASRIMKMYLSMKPGKGEKE
jgi:DNA-binding transcriptional MerR regulator